VARTPLFATTKAASVIVNLCSRPPEVVVSFAAQPGLTQQKGLLRPLIFRMLQTDFGERHFHALRRIRARRRAGASARAPALTAATVPAARPVFTSLLPGSVDPYAVPDGLLVPPATLPPGSAPARSEPRGRRRSRPCSCLPRRCSRRQPRRGLRPPRRRGATRRRRPDLGRGRRRRRGRR
jgi:hypothetical protein